MSNNNADYYFLRGGGEMGEMIRAKDWSNTPLGDPSTWPQSLCTMVAVMLDNPFGMYIAWGNKYTQLYNDGYRPILGATKHPQALGISTRETFAEIWHIIESMFDGVMKGQAVGFPDFMLPLNRYGYEEECYFDFSYSPIRKDNGEVGGVLVTVIETTGKKKATDALKESNARFINNILQAPVAMCVFRGPNHIVEIANEKMLQLWGTQADKLMNKPIFEGLPEVKGQGLEGLIDKVYNTGEKFVANERPVNLLRNGKTETIYVNFVYDSLKEADGTISGIVAIAVDVTQQVTARSQVEESEERYHHLIFSSPSAIGILKGEDLVITIANEPIIKIWGKGKEIIGRKYFEALPELAAQGYREVFGQVYKTGIPFNAIETPVTIVQDGETSLKYYNFILYPQRNINNEIDGIGIIATEVTSQALLNNRVRESEERFRSLAQTLPQLVWVTDAAGHEEFASSRWKDYTGIEPRGEKEWKEIVHPDDYDHINAAWAHSLTTGSMYNADVRLKSKYDEYRWHTVKGEPVLDKENKIVKWVGAFTDIQDQKIREEKKDEFISIASHEMKTPLTTAKGYLQMLESLFTDDNEEASLYLNKASEAVNRLNVLISELLDVSKIRLGKLNYTITTFNFNTMIVSTVENVQLTSQTHTIIKSGTVANEVTGDKDRLQQVIINLLNNAIKYSPGAREVFIDIAQEKNTIKVSVKDSGIGIAKQSLNKIFEKYHRVEEHAIHFQGLGIGLFISYEIIQRHHGNLWVESETGKGSTFYFTIPVNSNLPL